MQKKEGGSHYLIGGDRFGERKMTDERGGSEMSNAGERKDTGGGG